MNEQFSLSGGFYTKSDLKEEGLFEDCCVTYFKRFGYPRDGVRNVRKVQSLIPGCNSPYNCKWNPLEFKI